MGFLDLPVQDDELLTEGSILSDPFGFATSDISDC
jgi:hypothetical protein